MSVNNTVGVAEPRQSLTRYLRRVEHGERLVVTNPERPVAELGPPPTGANERDRLLAEGRVSRPATIGSLAVRIRFVYRTIEMPATATIRVTPETRDRLNRISAERGISAGELVDELAAHAEDGALLEAMESHYERLRSDPQAWEAFRAEVTAWDATAGDGLTPPG